MIPIKYRGIPASRPIRKRPQGRGVEILLPTIHLPRPPTIANLIIVDASISGRRRNAPHVVNTKMQHDRQDANKSFFANFRGRLDNEKYLSSNGDLFAAVYGYPS
jgi:hypothetical protein